MVKLSQLRWCDNCKVAIIPHYEWEPVVGDAIRVATCPVCHDYAEDPVDLCPFCGRPKNYWHPLCPQCYTQFTIEINALVERWENPATNTYLEEVLHIIYEIYSEKDS